MRSSPRGGGERKPSKPKKSNSSVPAKAVKRNVLYRGGTANSSGGYSEIGWAERRYIPPGASSQYKSAGYGMVEKKRKKK